MPPDQTTIKAGELTSLHSLKTYLEIGDNNSDELLARMISAASDYIQGILNRKIGAQAYTDRRNGNNTNCFVTSNYPILSVTGVTINGNALAPAINDFTNGYTYDDDAIYYRGGIFTKGVQNITLNYTAGYAVIPPIIEDFAIELCARKFKYKDRVGQVSKILAGETVTFEKADLTEDMKSILRNFQKVVPN